MSGLPHPLALFSLCPRNERAERVVSHPNNSHHRVSILDGGRLTYAIGIGFHTRGKSSTTLATLGRGVDVDIFVEGNSVSKLQCSFEINPGTGVVMLYDRSHCCTTRVSGENVMPFEYGRVRRVLVQRGLNTVIGMGGERCDLVQFELVWYRDHGQTAETIKSVEALSYHQVENPRLTQTMDVAATELSSRRETRPHTPGNLQLKMRYVMRERLGSGQFGIVYKAIDVDSGKFMAVKIIRRPTEALEQEQWKASLYFALKREVETLSRIYHPYIVDYIGSQGWDGPQLEIFMGLKEGSLQSLVSRGGVNTSNIAEFVFPQMLQALDYIASIGIVHRDVKPENILYVSQAGGRYQFQLGDFGLCNRTIDAATFAGSPPFMAPEMFQGAQTHKVDVWSLFVTMLWVMDANGFRGKSYLFKTYEDVKQAILSAESDVNASKIREMAVVNPGERASAAQMLVKHYNGDGLSTPRSQVPPLGPPASPTRAITRRLRRNPAIDETKEMFRILKARNSQLSRRYGGPLNHNLRLKP
ncbi:MAG: hypothetical protein M1840_004826 [Geoglossum simile]|nr:MAG: hypothetical protein M1840_004826 [Geoglossum simile]